MKKFTLLTLLFFSLIFCLKAQVPQGFSYQAVARDANGSCITDDSISLQISILDSLLGGTLYKEEFRSVATNPQGLFSIEIGKGIPQPIGSITPQFQDINWISGEKWMEVEMDPANGFNFISVGIQQLMSVPYALSASNGKQFSNTNEDEFLHFNGKNGNPNVSIGGTADANGEFNLGHVAVKQDGKNRIQLYPVKGWGGSGSIVTRGSNDTRNVVLSVASSATLEAQNTGAIRFYDDNDDERAYFGISSSVNKTGYAALRGPNGNRNVEISALDFASHPNKGMIYLRDDNDGTKLKLGVSSASHGIMETYGPNGNFNVTIGSSSSSLNHGGICIRDANGTAQACIFIDANGQGVVTGDLKPFFMDHPRQPNKEIWYCAIEGPEAAAYERGTATLLNGEAEITFSEHFEIVANPTTMTIIVTPRSPDSKGLAAFEYNATGFKVKELFQGRGNYTFDWEAKAVRKGHEDFEVVRDKEKFQDVEPGEQADDK